MLNSILIQDVKSELYPELEYVLYRDNRDMSERVLDFNNQVLWSMHL